MKNRKAISPVIGAILLISLTITIAAIVSMWIKSTTTEIAEEQGDVQCRNLDYQIGNLCDNSDKSVEFDVQNFATDSNISGFMVVFEYEGGIKSVFDSSEIAPLDSMKITTEPVIALRMNRIKIVPRVKSGDKISVCEEKEIIKIWNEITDCD